jgi:Ca-activated chloride channel family protein
MLTLVRVLVAVSSLLGAAGVWVAAQEPPVFRSSTQTVPVYVTVIGEDGRLVTNLTRDDFEVFDDGRPQPITLFDSGVQPISIIMMLDMSGSMLGHVTVLRNAAVQMFTRLEAGDKARVGSFGDRIVISPTFTKDVDTLIRTLWFDLKPGGSTPLWGAINAAMAGLAQVDGRRVVLVLSDGKNSPRTMNGLAMGPTLEDVIRRAEAEDFMVYSIGMRSRSARLRSPGESDEPDPGLRQLAHDSGGGYIELEGTDDLGVAFARVADELHRQYLLGFAAPDADGRIHRLEVRVKDPTMHPRARRTYQAPGHQSSSNERTISQ